MNVQRELGEEAARGSTEQTGVDGSVKGWQEDSLKDIDLADLSRGKIGQLKDLMGAVTFQSSDASSYITGYELRVDSFDAIPRFCEPHSFATRVGFPSSGAGNCSRHADACHARTPPHSGSIKCTDFTSDYGATPLYNRGLGGWIGIQKAGTIEFGRHERNRDHGR
ncbi:hypothetical protein K490DRAFT_69172 [Saccharata proteae CBS 121410]|uniref:Uncharacterized protein n=1 Tax=Saccharata proteae CBS 121410 TaxID=1314787 RepID=A0A9P4HP10_9PEZI|nr:hypothetical protein K490DRAFT_69172 [Saccharata proteae CBS 121410]